MQYTRWASAIMSLTSLSCAPENPSSSTTTDPTIAPVETTVDATSDDFTYVIDHPTTYYTGGPQQGRPPDGTLPNGTRVRVIRDEGSYTLVETVDGMEAHVATDCLKSRGETHTP